MKTALMRQWADEKIGASLHPVFKDVSDETMQEMMDRSTMSEICALSGIYNEGAASGDVHILERGSVRLFCTSDDGSQVTLEVLKAPAVFGAAECITGTCFLSSAQAMERSVVRIVPAHVFRSAVRGSPALCQNFLRDIAALFTVAAYRQRAMAFDSVEARLAQVLLSYSDAYGLPVHDGVQIRLPMSQLHMATVLGVSLRSVTRALLSWSRRGILAKRSGRYVIKNIRYLALVAGEDQMPMVYSSDLPLAGFVPKMEIPHPQALPRSALLKQIS